MVLHRLRFTIKRFTIKRFTIKLIWVALHYFEPMMERQKIVRDLLILLGIKGIDLVWIPPSKKKKQKRTLQLPQKLLNLSDFRSNHIAALWGFVQHIPSPLLGFVFCFDFLLQTSYPLPNNRSWGYSSPTQLWGDFRWWRRRVGCDILLQCCRGTDICPPCGNRWIYNSRNVEKLLNAWLLHHCNVNKWPAFVKWILPNECEERTKQDWWRP